MDWTTLTGASGTAGSLASYCNSDRITAAVATDLIKQAESAIYRRLRHWQMLTELTSSVFVIGNDYIALPADFLSIKSFYTTGTNFKKLELRTEEEVKANYSYDSTGTRVNQQASIFYFNQTNFKFDSPADVAYTTDIVYYQQPTALSAGNTTNFLTTTYPRLLLSACMAAACEFLKDVGQGNYDRTYWSQVFMADLQAAQVEADMATRAKEVGVIFV